MEKLKPTFSYQITDVVTKKIGMIQLTVLSKKHFEVRKFINLEFQWVHVDFSFIRLI